MKDFFIKHKVRLGIIVSILAVLITTFFVIPNDYKFFAKDKTLEYELGTEMSSDISTYAWGVKKAITEASLDISKVDIFTAGDYEAYVSLGKRTITYDVKIVDTVAPDLTIDESVKYIGIGQEYDAYKFVEEVTDLSNTSTVYFKVDEDLQDKIIFDSIGEYTITIVATDISGNQTEKDTAITAEVPPRFMGLADITIPVGADYDYAKSFIVYDETDGFITPSVSISGEVPDFSAAGSYPITYSVANSKGVDSQKTVIITTSPDASSDYKYATNLTSDDWAIMTTNNYFGYSLLDPANTDENQTVELVKPISINFTKHYSDVQKTTGSGFIYDIQEDYLYGISVEHVLNHMTDNVHVTFFDDQTIVTSIEWVDAMPNSELAYFRIPTSSIPRDTLFSLKKAYIDVAYYDQIPAGTSLIEYSENHGFQPSFTQKVRVVSLKDAYKANYKERTCYNDPALCTTSKAIGGMSGGPIMDFQGRVLGSLSYKVPSLNEDYSMKLDRIDILIQRFSEAYN